MDKFQTSFDKINKLVVDFEDFKHHDSRSLGYFHDQHVTLETNVYEVTDILKQWEEKEEFKLATHQAPPPP